MPRAIDLQVDLQRRIEQYVLAGGDARRLVIAAAELLGMPTSSGCDHEWRCTQCGVFAEQTEE